MDLTGRGKLGEEAVVHPQTKHGRLDAAAAEELGERPAATACGGTRRRQRRARGAMGRGRPRRRRLRARGGAAVLAGEVAGPGSDQRHRRRRARSGRRKARRGGATTHGAPRIRRWGLRGVKAELPTRRRRSGSVRAGGDSQAALPPELGKKDREGGAGTSVFQGQARRGRGGGAGSADGVRGA